MEDIVTTKHNLCILNDSSSTYVHPATGSSSAIDLSICSPDIFLDMHCGGGTDPPVKLWHRNDGQFCSLSVCTPHTEKRIQRLSVSVCVADITFQNQLWWRICLLQLDSCAPCLCLAVQKPTAGTSVSYRRTYFACTTLPVQLPPVSTSQCTE